MTLQAKAFQWSMGIHGMLILAVIVLQSFTVLQTKVAVVDFTLSGNNAPPAVKQTSPSQGPAVKREPMRTATTRPKAAPKKTIVKEAIVKEVVGKKNVKDVVTEQITPLPEVDQAPSPIADPSTTEKISTALPSAVGSPGGSSAEGKGSSIPFAGEGDGVGALPAEGAPRDTVDRAGLTQGTTEHSSNASTGPSHEASRATYLKEHFVYIRDRITGGISYPHMARKMGWCGQVKIAFVVCEDGSVGEVSVVESSGFGLLDRNAVETVKSVAPFPRPPVRAEIRMVITYRLS